MLQDLLIPRKKLFWGLATIALLTTLIHFVVPEVSLLLYFLKPLATLLIIALAYQLKEQHEDQAYARWITLALWPSLGGDIVLMFEGFTFFISGIAFFLIAHLFFILAFIKNYRWQGWQLWSLIGTSLYGAAMMTLMFPKLGSLAPAVVVYCLVIMAMVFFALSTFGNQHFPKRCASIVVVASLLFLVSDSLLAWNKFMSSIPLASVWILGSYYLAIYLFTVSIAAKNTRGTF